MKNIIAMILLTAALIAGGIILFRQGGGMMGMMADLSQAVGNGRQWVEIKPRTGASGGAAEGSEQTPAKIKTVKTIKPAINWCAPAAGGQTQKQVIFNEFAWMGGVASYSDEWIELKNISGQDLSLAGWQLQNKNQKIKVSFGESDNIPAGGLYLLERTDDNSAFGAAANKIYSGSTANEKEALYLFDAACQLQDSALASPKWPAGDNTTKQTMMRTANLLWRTSLIAGGTPGAENH